MFNIKTATGTFKGLIGECMFKITRRYAVLTRFSSRRRYFSSCGRYFTKEQLEFLDKNWYSLDSVEVTFTPQKQVLLYEIKTQSFLQNRPVWWKPKITEASIAIYQQAIELGFVVKLATVILYDNWNYEIVVEPFSPDLCCIDKPKKYDKS